MICDREGSNVTNKEIKEALQQEGMPMLRTMKGNLVLYLPI